MLKSSKLTVYICIAITGIFLLGSFGFSQAAINQQINYQGKLTDATDVTVADGAYDVVFKLYTVAGGGTDIWNSGNGEAWTSAALFTETGTTTYTDDGCAAGVDKMAYSTDTNEGALVAGQYLWNTTKKESAIIQSVSTSGSGGYICVYDTASAWSNNDDITNRIYVKSGQFSVMLGTITSLASVNFNQTLYLGVTVGADSEMAPRKILGAVPGAFEAKQLGGYTWASPDSLGSTNPNTGAFTTLSAASSSASAILTVTQSGAGYGAIITGGNVGIGDATPSALLTVGSGDLFQVNSSGAIAAAAGITSSGTITFSGLTTAGPVITSALGVLSSEAQLALARGGTAANLTATAGGIVYSGASALAISAAGSSGQLLISGGTGAPTWTSSPSVTDLTCTDCLDFAELEDTLDLDAALTLNQGTNTWTQNFTGTTTTGLTYNADAITTGTGMVLSVDGLTAGTGLDISSTSNAGVLAATSKLLNLVSSGTNAGITHTTYGLSSSLANTGADSNNYAGYFNAQDASYNYGIFGAASGGTTSTAGYFSASGATNNYGLIVAAGNVGIGDATPSALLTVGSGDLFQVTSTGQLIQTITLTDTGSVQDINLTLGDDTNADTVSGLNIDVTSSATGDADLLYALNIGNITAQAVVTETAINIGTGWDTILGGTTAGTNIFSFTNASLTSAGALVTATLDTGQGANELYDMDQNVLTTSAPQFARLGLGIAADATDILTASSTSTTNLSKAINAVHTGAITGTGYAGYFSKTGAATTNVGLYATASGATNNYAAIFEAGNVGIGTTAPGALLDLGLAGTTLGVLRFAGSTSGNVTIQPATTAGTWTLTLPASGGTANYALTTNGSGTANWVSGQSIAGLTVLSTPRFARLGLGAEADASDIITITTSTASSDAIDITHSGATGTGIRVANSGASGTLTGGDFRITGNNSFATQTTYGLYSSASKSTEDGSATNYGLYAEAKGATTGSGTTTNYGIYVDASGGDVNYGALFVSNSPVGIGTSTPGSLLTVGLGADLFQVTGQGKVIISPNTIGTYLDFVLETEWISGTLINADFASATTQNNDIVGMLLNFNTNLTGGADKDVTGINVQTPVLTSATAVTTNYTGYNISAAGALTQNTLAGTINWRGLNMAMPNITQTTGTITSSGLFLTTGSITTGGTQYGLNISASGVGAGTLSAINIGSITASGGTETALAIGSGWDTDLAFVDTSPTITIGDGGTLSFTDGTNTLLSLADSGTTGTLTVNTITPTTINAFTAGGAIDMNTNIISNIGNTGTDFVASTGALTLAGVLTANGGVTVAANQNLTLSSGTGVYSQTFTGDTTDALTITATSLTSGSAVVLTGTSGATAGVTDAILKLSSDVGDIGTSNGLISSTATIDSTAASANGVNLYLSTTNSPGTNANSAYGLYSTLTDGTALANTLYGLYSTVSTASQTSSGTYTTYGGYFTNAGTTTGTTTAVGVYATASGADNNYALFGAKDAIGAGPSPGLVLKNSTLATAGVTRQDPPAIRLDGNSWVSGANQNVFFDVYAITSANGAHTFNVRVSEGGSLTTLLSINDSKYWSVPYQIDIWAERDNVALDADAVGASLTNWEASTSTYNEFSGYLNFHSTGWKTDATAASQQMALAYINDPEQGAASPIGVHKVFYGTNNATPSIANEIYRLQWGSDTGVLGFYINDQSLNGFTFRVEGNTNANLIFTDGPNDRVGIGTATPSTLLDVQGAVQVNLPGTGTGNALCHTNQTGVTDEEIVDCTSGPVADYAEMYPTEEGLESGYLVAPSHTVIQTKDGKDLARLTKTNQSYQPTIIGVVSDLENITDFNVIGYNIKESDNPMPIALNGRVQMKISLENGPIVIGDLLTSSSDPGTGMKATAPGRVIGMALESFDGNDDDGKIMVFVNPHWYGGELNPNGGLPINQEQIAKVKIEIENDIKTLVLDNFTQLLKDGLEKLGFFIENGIARLKELIVDKITAKTVKTEKIEIVDQTTGMVYCAWLDKGEWQKTMGECSSLEPKDGGKKPPEPEQPPEIIQRPEIEIQPEPEPVEPITSDEIVSEENKEKIIKNEESKTPDTETSNGSQIPDTSQPLEVKVEPPTY